MMNDPLKNMQPIEQREFQSILDRARHGYALSTDDARALLVSMLDAAQTINDLMEVYAAEKRDHVEGTLKHENLQGHADAYRGMWAHFANRWYTPSDRTLVTPSLRDARKRKEKDE